MFRGGKVLILGRVQYLNMPYFARKCPKFRRSAKDGQLYHPGRDRRNAWITASYSNGSRKRKKMPILSRWTFERGQVPDEGRSTARSKETGQRWQASRRWVSTPKKGKACNVLIISKKKEKEKGKHKRKQKETTKGKNRKEKETHRKCVILGGFLF